MAAIPRSTRCSPSRRRSSTWPSAPRCCTGSSRSCMSARIYAPIWQLAFINGQGKRVGQIRARLDPGPCLFRTVRGRDDQGQSDTIAPPTAAARTRRQQGVTACARLDATMTIPSPSVPRARDAPRAAGPHGTRRPGRRHQSRPGRRTASSSMPRISRSRRPGSIRRKRRASSPPSCCSTPCMTGW